MYIYIVYVYNASYIFKFNYYPNILYYVYIFLGSMRDRSVIVIRLKYHSIIDEEKVFDEIQIRKRE